ncbi:hypothetical protein UFOVP972_216 [uncultured Caudovirales phage]|uniref:Uncharacterized protein n=1 Tax=uncultured Caudovirales phage TaxID=2100421 RepID=A0A6J5PU85_9CAUD|nr:hypothetical protein UFOVP972_216 [uncultured Caudovirales phage]
MPGRVLNFLEFSDKYSNTSSEPTSIDDLTNAAANFEEGFDDTTYDQPQIGPNRPVSGNYEATPSKPGEEGSPAFSANNTEEMNAPSEGAEHEEEESPEEEEAEHAEGGSEEGESDEEDEDDDQEEGNPEAGANPKKKKVEEGITLVKGFAQFVNESYEGYGNNPSQEGEDGEEVSAQAEEAVEMLNNREKQILKDYLENNPEEFKEIVKDELEEAEIGSNPRERDYDELGMNKSEFETRKIIHKIINYTGAVAALGVLPAAMFISGGIAAALGVTALTSVIFKDAAFASRERGHNYDAQRQAEKEWNDEKSGMFGMYPEDEDHDHEEEDDTCEMCGEVSISNEYGYSCGCNM